MNPYNEIIVKNIKHRLLDLGWSTRFFAERLETPLKTVQRWLSGRQNLDTEILYRISRVLQTAPETLVSQRKVI